MTATSPDLSSDTRTLGQVLHDARRKHNPKTERPRNVAPWDERAPWQQELDEEMAADLEAEVRARVAADFQRLAGDLQRFPEFPPGGPGIEREAKLEAWLAAVQVALHGLAERSDGEEPQP